MEENFMRRFFSFVINAIFFMLLAMPAYAMEYHQVIDINKMKTKEIFTGPYSFFVPPYSFYYFQHMDKLDLKLDWVRRSGNIYPLQEPKHPFTLYYTFNRSRYNVEDYFKRNAVLGFIVLKDNQIVAERYFHGADQHSLFLSNSIGKSITSTLLGIALDERKIASIDDPVTKYLPELIHSGFNRVTIRQALEMASGLDLHFNPYDPNTIPQFDSANLIGIPSFTNILKSVKANMTVVPGKVFDYENENTEMLGLLIEKAVGVRYNQYLQTKIWNKIGAESDAFLYRAKVQQDQCTFGCFNATLRDYARFGLMMMNNGTLGGISIVTPAWVKAATTPVKYDVPPKDSEHLGYGYQWWILSGQDHAYKGLGIFGQILYVNPTKHIVIVQIAAWPTPEDDNRWEEFAKVAEAIDLRS